MTDKRKIEDSAVSLLLEQNIYGEFALSFFDYRKIKTRGRTMIGTFGGSAALGGINKTDGVEGVTVKYGNTAMIFYDETVKSRERIFWTVAHELGHIILKHKGGSEKEELEADRFAAALLMPESVIRYLDKRLGREITPEEMGSYFSASLTARRRRRNSIGQTTGAYETSAKENQLTERLFCPEKFIKQS